MPTTSDRFTQTIENYIRYRPSYPTELVHDLAQERILTPNKIIADVGSGTGFLSKLFLNNGNVVQGVEPNIGMRQAAEYYLKSFPNFHSVAATAENTTLTNDSVDIVTVGTAFHWFDSHQTQREFKRILKQPGYVVLVWNTRALNNSKFMQCFEELILEYCHEFRDSVAQKFDETITQQFFSPFAMQIKSYAYAQQFDLPGLKGRLLSTSYSLRPNDTRYLAMLNALEKLFDEYQQQGKVEFLYTTKMYYGQLK